MREYLLSGGALVRLASGGLGVEGVPDARRGLVVYSALWGADGDRHTRGSYRLTQREVPGTDLWRVVRLGPVPA